MHPGMDAAIKVMGSCCPVRDVEVAALDDSGSSDRNVLETTCTFGNSGVSCIKRFDEATTELSDLSEGVWLPALVHNTQNGPSLNVDRVGFDVPTWVRGSSGCPGQQVIKSGR